MKTYIVVLKVEAATGTQTFRVAAENADDAVEQIYDGCGVFLEQDIEVQAFSMTPELVEEIKE